MRSLHACDAIPLLGSCAKMHFPEIAQPASACLQLVASCNRSFRSSSGTCDPIAQDALAGRLGTWLLRRLGCSATSHYQAAWLCSAAPVGQHSWARAECLWSCPGPWLPSKPHLLQCACATGRISWLPGPEALLPKRAALLGQGMLLLVTPRTLAASASPASCTVLVPQAAPRRTQNCCCLMPAGHSLIAACASHRNAAPRPSTTHKFPLPSCQTFVVHENLLGTKPSLSLPAGRVSAEGSARPDTRSDNSCAPGPTSEPVTDATLRIGSQELGPQAATRQASEDEPATLGRPSTSSSVRQAPQHLRTASGSSTEAASSVGGPHSSTGGGQPAPQQGQAGMSQPGPSGPQAAPHGERTARVQRVVPAQLNAVPKAPPGGYTSLRIIGGKAVYVSHDGKQVSCRTDVHAGSTPTLQEGLSSSALSMGGEAARTGYIFSCLVQSSGLHPVLYLLGCCQQPAEPLYAGCHLPHVISFCCWCRSLLALGRQDLTSSVAASPPQLIKRLGADQDSREQAWLVQQTDQLSCLGWEPGSVPLLGQAAFQVRAPSSLIAQATKPKLGERPAMGQTT